MHPPSATHQPSLTHAAVHLLVSAVSVFIVAKVLPGVRVKSFTAALAFAFVVAVLNVMAWWFLAPYEWLSQGLGGFVLNGVIFLVAARIVGGMKISGCVMAAIAAVCVTFVSHFIQHLVRQWVR